MREVEEDMNKTLHVHGLEELILFKCSHHPKKFTD
jgi:hypothetical protein